MRSLNVALDERAYDIHIGRGLLDRGDLFAELRIVVPRELSPEERAAYEQLARATRPHERHG